MNFFSVVGEKVFHRERFAKVDEKTRMNNRASDGNYSPAGWLQEGLRAKIRVTRSAIDGGWCFENGNIPLAR